jgi:predicted metal-binding protein
MRIGIIICDRYHTCGGGKCFRSVRERAGACPGGNVEYVPEEMIRNGAEAIHLATGMVVGYPPCPYLAYFESFIQERYGVPVVLGTHPIPEKYLKVHKGLVSLPVLAANEALLATEEVRRAYD